MHRMPRLLAPALLTLALPGFVLAGCNDGEGDDSIFSSGNDSPADDGDGDTDDEVGEDAETSEGGGAKLDMAGGEEQASAEDGMGTDPSCAKVDVLYVIDNSPSMYEEQQTLIANFGAFVNDMQVALADVESYHVGVITSDNYVDEGFLDDSSPTVNASQPDCRILGGLVVEGQQGLCKPFASGDNYLTEDDVLEAEFQCIANVGEDGDSDERMGDALIAALAGGQQDAGCNRNFLRDDALLIVVMLTDENDSSNASTQDWFDAVVETKGTEENVVMLALIWDEFASGCESSLSESDGWQIEDFAEMFSNHAVGNICESSYAGFFQNAIPTIDSACENFTPVE